MTAKKQTLKEFVIGDVVKVDAMNGVGKIVRIDEKILHILLESGETRHYTTDEVELSNEEFEEVSGKDLSEKDL